MATGISGASRLRDDVDYSLPHRPAPAIPTVAYSSTSPKKAPEIGERPFQSHSSDYEQQIQRARSRGHGRVNGSYSESRPASRKNSFGGLLRRSSSHTHPDHPPLPQTRINTDVANTQAQTASGPRSPSSAEKSPTYFHFGPTATITSAVTSPGREDRTANITTYGDGVSGHERTGIFRTKSRDSNKRQPNMLRKSSKAREQKAELERQQREAQLLPRQPPRLPSHNPLPGIATFDDQDSPRDSVAIFNQHAYTSPRSPPTVPAQAPHPGPQLPQAANFSRPGNVNMLSSSSPAYAVRGASASVSPPPPVPNGDIHDSCGERTSSMTNRGRYSYASTAQNAGNVNSPRRVRRRKDPTPFNVLVVGTKNSGKSSFINFLSQSLALPSAKQQDADTQTQQTRGAFTSTYVESDMDGERVGLTIWDSVGLEKNVVDLQLREMTNFIEAKFEDTFTEEQKVMRSPGFKDTHIHCVFLILDPVRLDATIAALANVNGGPVRGVGALDDEVDMQVLRALWGKTTVIPVISKADTVTIGHMTHLKRSVWQSIKASSMSPLDALELEDDDEEDDEEQYSNPTGSVIDNLLDRSDSESEGSDSPVNPKLNKRASHTRNLSLSAAAAATADEDPYIPMSILSPDPYDLPPYTPNPPKPTDLGRRFPWGTASPFNESHCDYIRLRDSVFSEWRGDLRELSRVKWYEQWRTSRLRNVPGSKQRLKGGVTPVGSVPREGRSESVRNFSAGPSGVPRSVSGQGQSAPAMPGVPMSMPPPSVGTAVSTPAQQNGIRAAAF